MFYLAVVLEKGYIVDCGLDAQDKAEFVVHLYRHWPHFMFDPGAANPGVQIIAHFILIVLMKLTAQIGYRLRFDLRFVRRCT